MKDMKSALAGLFIAAVALGLPAHAAAGEQDPRGVVQSYYAAIDRKDYRAAYQHWDHQGRASGKSYGAFRKGSSATAHSRVTTGMPTDADAGMSQRWITVPVEVHATLANGKRQHFRGTYTLHRVVEGVGAPAESERWHISSASLRPVP